MTAEPTTPGMWSPDPIMQRTGRYTIEHVLALPDDAPRVELRDGVIIVVPSPTGGHQDIGNLLWMWFRQNTSEWFRPFTAVGVAIGLGDTFEPDVVLLKEPVSDKSHYFLADQVVIAVEIVSKSTKRRDRLEKPVEYAAVGIPHFWRIEQDPLHVFAYDLVDGAYQLVADAGVEDELVLSVPFEIRLPVRDIAP
ncbi:Uma2 family endonuclease [Actinoplanes sp. RD1]|uniref:Uma2 family endonuclease n=1 Tax=Actinoplanes sp. RD1 TaxID=3064538 RepID=UPI00274160E9|nr:Uma2 family endonuclease [Actinoplanes sp. RD1]